MVASLWGTNSTLDQTAVAVSGDDLAPVVADSGGGSFGIAWINDATVSVRFFDVVGGVDPALGTLTLSDGLYGDTADAAIVSGLALTAGGAVGYAAVWQESSSSDPASDPVLRGRYVGLAGTVGAEFTIAAEPGAAQHDASISGYVVDGPAGKAI